MTIQYCSDLHLEFPGNKMFLESFPLQPEGDVLILAGDILPFALHKKQTGFIDFVADNYLDEAFDWTIYGPVFYDATLIEFDFIPSVDRIKFPVIFASEAYGTVLTMSYVLFALLLTTDNGTGPITTNIALVPGTDDPISVATIMNDGLNSEFQSPAVPGVNEEYFGGFYGSAYQVSDQSLVQSPYDTPINFSGNTVEMLVDADVVPGQLYHIKMVIADREYPMSAYDAAAFIGPFTAGIVDLGEDLTVTSGNAICPGSSATIYSHLDPEDYTFQWFNDNGAIEGATGPDLVVTQPGTYSLDATFSENCHATDSILIEFYEEVIQPQDLVECSVTGFATFDFSLVSTAIQEGANEPDNLQISYHASENDAVNEISLDITYENIVEYIQPIFVRIENTANGCITMKTFNIVVQDLTPQFSINDDFSICEGTEGFIQVEAVNFDSDTVSYIWMHDNSPIEGNDSLIVNEEGVYKVTINNSGCTASAEVTVSVIAAPVAVAPEDIVACASYILPELPDGSSYHTGSGGTGTQYNVGDIITEGQTIYVFAQSDTLPNCTDENSFTITITQQEIPVTGFTLPAVVCSAATDIIPVLAEGFTSGGIFFAGDGLSINPETGVIDLSESLTGNYSVTYAFGEDIINCIAAGSTVVTIEVIPAVIPETEFNFEDVYCGGNSIVVPEFSENFIAGGVFNSTAGLVIDSSTGEIDITASDPGSYTVTYTIQPDPDNCRVGGESFDNFVIDQNLSFIVEQYCDGNDYFVRAVATEGTFHLATFEWVTGNGISVGMDDAMFNVTDYADTVNEDIFPLELMLTVISNGCEYSEIMMVEDILCEIPRGISPNGDGKNDNLDLIGFDVNKISIFNRYGMEVYSRQNYSNEWHGQANNGDDLPTGTYFYMIERANGESFTGWIYLNRK